jgi:hypothetical protein
MKDVLLHRDVYACRTEDGSILMDLRTGRYFGLDLRSTCALASRVQGWGDIVEIDDHRTISKDESARLIDTLKTNPPLLTESPKIGKAAAFPTLIQTDCIPFWGNLVPRPRIRAHHVWAFCCAYSQALWSLKARPLSVIVRRVQARKSTHVVQEPDQQRIEELVRIFRSLRPLFYTAKNRCLLDSLVLVEFLRRFDIFPVWVIAVRTRPFGAHSWVLSGVLLLNERLETAEEFVPILAV